MYMYIRTHSLTHTHLLLAEPGVNHVDHSVDGQRSLCDIGRHDHLSGGFLPLPVYVCVCVCVYVCVRIRMCVYEYKYMCVCVYVCMCDSTRECLPVGGRCRRENALLHVRG
jgi:hypothetical protein